MTRRVCTECRVTVLRRSNSEDVCGPCTYRITREALEAFEEGERVKDRILTRLTRTQRAAGAADLARDVDCTLQAASRALSGLVDDGRLERVRVETGDGRRVRYRLPQVEAA